MVDVKQWTASYRYHLVKLSTVRASMMKPRDWALVPEVLPLQEQRSAHSEEADDWRPIKIFQSPYLPSSPLLPKSQLRDSVGGDTVP